jgi:drug/metabolite transporter (DMT)-like permease
MTVHQEIRTIQSAASTGNIRAKLMLVLLCLLWGTNWTVMKIALQEIPPLSMRTISSAFGALTLLGICVVSHHRLRVGSAKTWGHVCIIGLLNVGFFGILSAYAQITAATTRVTILAFTMPIWAVLLAWAVLRERPNATQVLAVVLCALGLAVLIYPLATRGVPLGLLLAVAAGATWGAGTVYVKWARLELDPLGATFWQLVIAFGAIAGCLIAVDGRLNLDHAHTGSFLAAAFAGIIGSGIAYALWFEIVRRLPAATASLGALGIPVVGVVSTVLITGETLGAADIVGFALIFAASVSVLVARSTPARGG